ncbi:family 78 glycoside hydrolase catalytic domain [Roseimarinus sediminis]|uniref:family 78 glycoside hydrolase catalytic domain n=1 Tax=Roseimarinus sediminis TaxID=1610899 RepID=UPI003D213CC2
MIGKLLTEHKTNPLGIATPKPRFSWQLKAEGFNLKQTAYHIRCASDVQQLNSGDALIWDSGKITSEQSLHIEYNGAPLHSDMKVYWKVKVWDNKGKEYDWSQAAYFTTGLFAPQDWLAEWIESGVEEDSAVSTPCPFLRNEFELTAPVLSARLYVTARGLYEMYLNGQKVGDQLFTPGWTSYHGRIQYQCYEVVDLLQKGGNAIGAILGDGWYRGYLGWQGKKNTYGDKTALLAQLHIMHADGSTSVITGNQHWKSATGPLLESDIYNGEKYDARLELSDWNLPGYDDSRWKAVKVANYPKTGLVASEGSPVEVVNTIQAIEKIITPKGEVVLDFGQNMVGSVRFRLKGNKGESIRLHHAEVLDQKGNFYLDNIRAAKAEDVYYFMGEGIESWSPRFTFHGFRYLRVSDYKGEINTNDFEGLVVHSNMEAIGSFECSDPLINQLQHNIVWGLKGNFLDVPTDCPQRDERLGWTGDAQVFAPTAAFNMNTAPFYTKWMKDFPIDQKDDGSIPWVVPNVVKDGGGTGWSDGYGATGWADAAIIIPWEMYQAYGDRRILEEQYESMKAWEEYMIRHAADRYIFDYGFHFGDWLSFAEYMSYHYNAPDYGYAGAYTEKELVATAYFYYSTGLMQQIAGILGKTDDAVRYASLRPKIKKAFQKEFITETGRITSNSQTAYALALMFGLYHDELKSNAALRLANDVRHFEHLTTGFLGTPYLCQALSENGYPELAYQLLFNKRYPSWLYPVTQGATTIWERWDCIKPDGSFQTAGMNSFNHYAYGAVGYWMYSNIAGIQKDPAHPGYKHFVVKPLIPDVLSHAKASLKSPFGMIEVHWEKTASGLQLDVLVPFNTTADIHLPAAPGIIQLNGKHLVDDKTISNNNNDETVFRTGSGHYIFLIDGAYKMIKAQKEDNNE